MPWTHYDHIYQVQDILAGTWKVHIRQSGQWDLVYSIHVKKKKAALFKLYFPGNSKQSSDTYLFLLLLLKTKKKGV